MNFTITQITPEGVFAKEVNPYGEKAPKYIPLVGGFEVLVDNDRNQRFREKYIRWELAESQLQEYPLTEDFHVHIWSKTHGGYWRVGSMGYTDNKDMAAVYYFCDAKEIVASSPEKDKAEFLFVIGQSITGEIVEENGIKKIQI